MENGLQQWVDMYNKADKERFDALLQRDKYKQCLDEIEKIVDEYSCKCWHACNDDIRQKIKEVKENE